MVQMCFIVGDGTCAMRICLASPLRLYKNSADRDVHEKGLLHPEVSTPGTLQSVCEDA